MENQEAIATLLKAAAVELEKVKQEGAAFLTHGDTLRVREAVDRVEKIQNLINIIHQLQNQWSQVILNPIPINAIQPQILKQPLSKHINFWWITAKPANWIWDTLFAKLDKKERFEAGRFKENFETAKLGDFIFGYQASPDMKIVALAEVSRELYEDRGKEQIDIRGIGAGLLKFPVSWRIIKAQIPTSQPVVGRAQGTLFHLTLSEARILARLIRQAGNQVELPDDLQQI